jgi:hypothetical protein
MCQHGIQIEIRLKILADFNPGWCDVTATGRGRVASEEGSPFLFLRPPLTDRAAACGLFSAEFHGRILRGRLWKLVAIDPFRRPPGRVDQGWPPMQGFAPSGKPKQDEGAQQVSRLLNIYLNSEKLSHGNRAGEKVAVVFLCF